MLLKNLPGLPTVESGWRRWDRGNPGSQSTLGLCEPGAQEAGSWGWTASCISLNGHFTVTAQGRQGTKLPLIHHSSLPPPKAGLPASTLNFLSSILHTAANKSF